tara:strand:+ start:197 stop:334 length:138 start_codon:yes stop_codon:yes gene_type:complete
MNISDQMNFAINVQNNRGLASQGSAKMVTNGHQVPLLVTLTGLDD